MSESESEMNDFTLTTIRMLMGRIQIKDLGI